MQHLTFRLLATHLFFTGPDRKQLAIASGGKTWVRPMLRQGVPPGPAFRPPAPRLQAGRSCPEFA